MRTAFYARYSNDLQSETSIEDQMRRVKARAQSEGWQIAGSYSDAAISGASLLRPGIQSLLADAQASKFDVVLCEALDRLSRNQADIARIYEQLTFNGIQIITLSEGDISELHIGLRGTMNALFLKDLAIKTRRGLEGRVRAGKSGGGKAYGYTVPVSFDGKGERMTGDMVINEREATMVRRILEMYAAGLSPRAIAHTLNTEDIKGPNGNAWGPSTINGNRTRGTGIINNELYIGRRVWNRLRYIKDPATGKRVSRLNPEDQWVIEAVPSLSIISDELWQRVRARQGALDTSTTDKRPHAFYDKQRPRYFWTGKMKCGYCGGNYTKVSKDLLGCATSRNKGLAVCANRKNIRVDTLEAHLLSSLQHHLMNPELFADFIDAFTRELNRLQGEARGERTAIEARIERIDLQLDTAIDAILDGANVARFKDRMHALEAEKVELKTKLDSMDSQPPLLLHPNMSHIYKEKVSTLANALRADRTNRDAFEVIRSLLNTVILHPTDAGFEFDIEGDLAHILSLSTAGNQSQGSSTTKPSQFLLEGSGELAEQVKMVAGVGFEPTTFRL